MRRLLLILSLGLLACQAVTSSVALNPALINFAPPGSVSPTLTIIPTASPTAVPPDETDFIVRYHPDGPLYVGDQVSLEVIAPPDIDLQERQVKVTVYGERDDELGSAGFGPFGIGGREQATMTWVWDTVDLTPGEYTLDFSIEPGSLAWQDSITLYPARDVPLPEPQARWETVETDCCIVNYITGTDVARNLPELLALIDEQGREAVQRMGTEFLEPIPVTLVPRILGHGGFAGNEIYVSYLDRNYAGNDSAHVIHHEMIHILDGRLGGELRPSIFVEGLAVYLTGGHFKTEPLMQRAAALLELGWYLPLAPLADNFYNSQHEIGYLEGGSLVQYMVNTFGWEAFDRFYRDIRPDPSGKQSQAIDFALRKHFGLTLAQLEQRFIAELHRQQINPDMYDDIHLSVAYYDTVRRYQQLLDPSAYFLTAWLPDGEKMRDQGIVADYLRRPSKIENIRIESLLVQADRHLRAGDYALAQKLLANINDQLDTIEKNLGTSKAN
jgi:hypothetical protein